MKSRKVGTVPGIAVCLGLGWGVCGRDRSWLWGGQEPGEEEKRNLDFIPVAMGNPWNISRKGVAWHGGSKALLLCNKLPQNLVA